MPGHSKDRAAEDIRREIVAVIRELKDPRVRDRILTVVRVSVSADLSFARVFVSSMKGLSEAEEAAKALNGAQGFIRGEIGKKLRLRKAPELVFTADDSVEQGTEIVRKLSGISGGKNED